MIACHDRERVAVSERVDARRLIGEWRRAGREQSSHGQGRHAGKEISQRAVDTEVGSVERLFRHRRHAQATETETRLVNNVRREDVSVGDRVEILNDVERATGAGQLRDAVAETREVVVGLESRVTREEVLRADRVLVVETPIEVCVELVLGETRQT